MKKNIRSIATYIISIFIAFGLLYLVFRSISLDEFLAQAENADYFYVCLSIAITLIAHIARAYRWKLLIEPTGHSSTTLRMTSAVLIGYIVNLVLPRMGEVTRCGVLKKTDNVPMSISLGTVISERIIDVLTLLIITLLALIIEFDKLSTFLLDLFTRIDSGKLLVMGIAGFLFLVFGAVGGLVVYKRLKGRFKVILDQLLEGLFSLRKLQSKTAFLVSTIVIWTTYFSMGYLIFFAVEQTSHLSWQAALMLLVSGSIAMTIPVQGGFGTFHSIASSMLLLYGIDKTTGVFFATLAHSSQVAATVIFGTIGLIMTVFLKQKSPVMQQKKDE